jgi:hypothetical protein
VGRKWLSRFEDNYGEVYKILLLGSELTAAVLSKPRWLRLRAVTVFTQLQEVLHCSSLACSIS